MSIPKKVCLLVGSFRASKSTSSFMGNSLVSLLVKNGCQCVEFNVASLLNLDNMKAYLSAVDDADVVIFSTPLYIDCEPYLVIRAMEAIARHRKCERVFKQPRFLVITNGGYPEAHHNDTAQLIYKSFCDEVGFIWIGGLSFGMGAAITVPIVRHLSPLMNNLKRSICITASAIMNDVGLPPSAALLMAKPLVPIWLYSAFARGIARFFSIANGAYDIFARPD